MSLPVVGRSFVLGWLLIGASQSTWASHDRVPWLTDLPTAQRAAAERNLPILLHFTADSCPPCRRLEKQVFSQAEFGYAVGQAFIPVKINVDHQPQVAQVYNVTSWPTDIVISPSGQILHQMISPQDGTQYLQALRQVAWHYQQQTNHSAVVSTPAGRRFQSPLTEYRNEPRPYDTAGLGQGMAATPSGYSAPPTQSLTGNYPASHDARPANSSQTPPSSTLNPTWTGAYAPVTTSATATAPSTPAADHAPSGYSPVSIQNPYFQPETSEPTVQPAASSVAVTSDSVEQAPPQPRTQIPAESLVQTAYQAAPQTNQLHPPSSPNSTPNVAARNSIAMDGYCPVTVMDENRWAPGNARWGAQHRGKIYLFQNEAAQQRFLADPERYAPVLAGFDPVAMADFGRFSPGKREHGVRYNERMYLFEDEDSLQRFSQSPDQYVTRVQATLQAIATGH